MVEGKPGKTIGNMKELVSVRHPVNENTEHEQNKNRYPKKLFKIHVNSFHGC
jgi:hypothetical protein